MPPAPARDKRAVRPESFDKLRTGPVDALRTGPVDVLRTGSANEWFLGAQLRFEQRPGVSSDDIRVLLAKRKATQPIGEWSCGSVFTNPPGDHAARLIEAAGLKGTRIGGARVSEMHANFIVNDGTASAADIEQLIRHVQLVVEQKHGVKLQTEVRIVGENR